MTDLGAGTIGKNIDRVGWIHVVVAELKYVVSSSTVVRVQDAGEEAVSVHRVVVPSAEGDEKIKMKMVAEWEGVNLEIFLTSSTGARPSWAERR